MKRAILLINEKGAPADDLSLYCESVNAFAHYIAAHEEPPVDPLLIEAREMAELKGFFGANQLGMLRSGAHDNSPGIQVILAALKRGIELAKEQS